MRKHKSDRWILLVTLVLIALGLVVIYAIGPMRVNYSNAAYGTSMDENYYFVHQIISAGMAVVAFFVAFFVPYQWMRKFSLWFLVLGLVLCGALVVLSKVGSGIASCENGACRWIRIGGSFSIQPAEILKLGLVLYLAQIAARCKEQGTIMKSDFWLPVGLMTVLSLVFVVYFQKDLGSTVILAVIVLGILLMSGIKLKYFAIICAVALVGGCLAIVTSPHRMERLLTFQNAESADTYHIDNALLAIGTGGLTGVGVGNTVQATGYLPESINDSVFAVMGEAYGFLGLMLVVLCYIFLLFRILKVYELRGNDEYGFVAIGVFCWITIQVITNICAMTGLIPLTGITLPLLSYGGTSMLFTAAALGLVMQLSCYNKRIIPNEKPMVSKRGIR